MVLRLYTSYGKQHHCERTVSSNDEQREAYEDKICVHAEDKESFWSLC